MKVDVPRYNFATAVPAVALHSSGEWAAGGMLA